MWNLAQRYLFIQKQYYYLRYRKRRKRSHMRNGGVFLLHSWWKWAMKSWMTPMNMEDPNTPNTPNRMKSLSIILRSRNIILSQHLKCAILGRVREQLKQRRCRVCAWMKAQGRIPRGRDTTLFCKKCTDDSDRTEAPFFLCGKPRKELGNLSCFTYFHEEMNCQLPHKRRRCDKNRRTKKQDNISSDESEDKSSSESAELQCSDSD